jgi:hypothetical protein
MTFWRTFLATLAKNPISTFAVLCVASTAAFLGYMTLRMAGVLESAGWCGKAIQAEKISPGSTYVGLTTCVELLTIQLSAIATGFHISVGAFAFSLIVLVVIVIAGARASGKIGATGLQFDMGKHDAEKGAQHVLEGAKEAADEVGAGAAKPADAGLPDNLK